LFTYRNVVTEMSRDRNGSCRNGQTENSCSGSLQCTTAMRYMVNL